MLERENLYVLRLLKDYIYTTISTIMSIFFPVSEFWENSGKASLLFNEQLRDGIANQACSIWENFPGFISQGSDPISSFARGYMNQMCQAKPGGFTPPTAPQIPFTGGQCVGAPYTITYFLEVYDPNNCGLISSGNNTIGPFQGPIGQIQSVVTQVGAGISNCGNFPGTPWDRVNFFVPTGQGNIAIFNGAGRSQNAAFAPVVSTAFVVSVARTDGQPDNCGNLPNEYPPVEPGQQDLNTTIVINNIDGSDTNYDLVYNKISNNYNFPIGFKLNGVNVVVDVGGITIFGNPRVTKPTTPVNRTDNDPPPPGSDGGNDGIGNNNDTVYDGDYPTLPDITTPETALEVIEYILCIDGVIDTISDTLKVITGNIPILNVIIDILKNLVEEICEIDEAVEATIGFPEWYGIRPGADRPAIVYLWKEYINDTWQKPTYSSTVSNPSAAAIADIPNIVSQDKTMGTWVASLTLTDGSRIRTSGDTEVVALNNFNFLLNQVDSAFIPAMVNSKIILSENQQLQVKTVKLRQIEYYPTGGGVNRNPAIRRRIDA